MTIKLRDLRSLITQQEDDQINLCPDRYEHDLLDQQAARILAISDKYLGEYDTRSRKGKRE